jgi:predicted metal-dependent peptidase
VEEAYLLNSSEKTSSYTNVFQLTKFYFASIGLPALPRTFFETLDRSILENLEHQLQEATQTQELGLKLLRSIKTELFMNYKFFGLSLSHFKEASADAIFNTLTPTIATNGLYLYFNPTWLMQQFKHQPNLLKRAYLHVLLHAIFKHMFQGKTMKNIDQWNLAVDISVEFMIDDLKDPLLENGSNDVRKIVYDEFFKLFPILHAKSVYEALQSGDFYDLCEAHRTIFKCDDHQYWYRPSSEMKNNTSQTKQSSNQQDNHDSTLQKTNSILQSMPLLEINDFIEEDLDEMAKRLELDLDTFHKQQGDEAANFRKSLQVNNRKHYDYRDFLRKFMSYREVMKESLDEFDYLYYTLGLQNYGNLPLIEPLEYSLRHVLETFVIAIDTSGSTFSSVVSIFLDETFQVLKQAELGYRRVEIYLIQCDAAIAEEKQFTTYREVESYLKNFELKGGGGTDFRPVFNRVDQLMEEGKLQNLKGLIYFTDGYGMYPEKRTPYETAFVFYEGDQYDEGHVPGWASKLVIQKEEIR